ncbi:hypothetical protein TPENAI_10560 [Tenacibaculum litopenaei]|uniref:gliding motility-associated C-terminal domain-containing protein n=1 Tax=Tenacibaculum litopenaei TaxID=396016 RepID=UPI00389494BD
MLVVDDGFKKPPLLSGLTSSSILANDSFRGTPIVLGDKELQLTVKTFGLPLGIELLTDGTLSISSQVRKGIYHFEYQLCENFSNPRNCKTATVVVFIDEDKDGDGIADSLDNQIVPCFTAYSYLTPNDDGKNDVLIISCLNESNYKNNDIKIYNRWGSLVYKKHGYQNNWNGISEASTTISSGSRLPTGTYYYVFDPGNGNSPRVGWIYLSTE